MANEKWIIGLTGNIATGKSVVRRMLMNHGAFGIDADLIAHRVLYPGGSAYQPVVAAFGRKILGPQGEINRGKLADIVFNQPHALQTLEVLTHPAVTQAIEKRINASPLPIVVVEAIKLLESPLAALCNTIWVSHTPESQQLARLMQTRNMSETDARQRIAAQPPQSRKLSRADVVITTDGSFDATWEQTHTALNDTIQVNEHPDDLYINIGENWQAQPAGSLPLTQLKSFWEGQFGKEQQDLFETLAFRVVLPVLHSREITLLLTWDHWNFTDRLISLHPKELTRGEATVGLRIFLSDAQMLQSELLIVPDDLAYRFGKAIGEQGFEQRSADLHPYPAWQVALAKAASENNRSPWFKVLAEPVETANPNKSDRETNV